MSVKIKIKSHIEQKNWENFGSMKKVYKNNKDLIENVYFSVDLAYGAKQKQHENKCCALQTNTCRNN